MSKPTLEMKWNQYGSSRLYLLSKDRSELVVIAEGDGSNLLEEDVEMGYADYWYVSSYDTNTGIESEGAQWLESRLISDYDYTIKQVIERNGFDPETVVTLDSEDGEKLHDHYMTVSSEMFDANSILRRQEAA